MNRIVYNAGFRDGVKAALAVFKQLQQDYEFTIDDKEFYLMLEDLKNESS